MKILHTADWHLGHRLLEQTQFEEQHKFLDWLLQTIIDHNIDIVLLSGDVFDTGVPSTQSQKLYYDFLIRLKTTNCTHIVITGGNHDAPGTLNAPKALLEHLSIHVVGKATENPEDEVLKLSVKDEEVVIAAVPYLRDQDIRRAIAGEDITQIEERYKTALINHYNAVAEVCQAVKTKKTPVIAMGHLFAIGSTTSDSEQTIYIGNLGDIGADDFPKLFDYIALGHLHRPQKVGKYAHIRYSGSPNTLSFSEVGYDKKVILLETEESKISTIEQLTIPTFRTLMKIKGTPEKCKAEIIKAGERKAELTPWIEIILDSPIHNKVETEELHRIAKDHQVEILKISLKNAREAIGLDLLMSNTLAVKELSPIDVFKQKCKEEAFDLKEQPEILDAFHEALQIAREN